MISHENLTQILNYDKETGIFTWKKQTSNRTKVGSIVGSVESNGYMRCRIKSTRYMVHRLVWFYVYEKWPNQLIDHINGIKNDNRIENLREVTNRQNQQNQYKHRDGKLVGASFRGPNKYQSLIKINKKSLSLGYFKTEIAAHEAYMKKVKEIESLQPTSTSLTIAAN